MATFNELVSRWLSNMTSGGAALVSVTAQADLPHTLSVDHSVTTNAAATLDFGTTFDISAYHNGQVYISVTTDTMAITGTRGSQTGIPVLVRTADDPASITAAATLGTGTYIFERLDFDSLTFTKTGTNAVGTVDARFTP